MKKVISPKTAAVAAYLQKKGFSKENPFIPSGKMVIHHFIECPTKYVFNYPFVVLAAWPDGEGLVVRCVYAKPVTELGFVDDKEVVVEKFAEPEERRIVDDECEEEDYEDDSFGTYEGIEISYWSIDGMMLDFFSCVPFGRPKEPFEGDFYYIEEVDGKKQIHINGSLWKSDDEWRHSEYVFLIVPLDEFIACYAERGNEYVDELFEGAKTSIQELTETDALKMMSRYFNNWYPDGMLDYSQIRLDTPVGNYATKWK